MSRAKARAVGLRPAQLQADRRTGHVVGGGRAAGHRLVDEVLRVRPDHRAGARGATAGARGRHRRCRETKRSKCRSVAALHGEIAGKAAVQGDDTVVHRRSR